jgi:hypothetical protein
VDQRLCDAILEQRGTASQEVSGPAETSTIPPAHVLPPENAAEIVLKRGNELL